MILIYGTGLYGKVDDVPGMWHVATRFGHLWYIPLIPLGSFIVLAKSGEDFQGVPISLNLKSVLAAWLRTGCVLLAAVAAVVGVLSFSEWNAGAGIAAAVVFGLSIVAMILSYKLRGLGRAGYARAKALGQRIGLSDQGELMLEVLFGRLSAAEADNELARRDEAGPP